MGLTAQNLKRIAGFLLGGAARPKLAKHFMWLFWGIGLLYLLIVPPFQVPDEPGHLFRAYQISQGGILAQKIDNRSGGFVPASFALTFQEAVRGKTTGQTILFNPDEKYDLGATQRCLHIPLRTGDVTFASFPGDTLYSPVPFLPQATAILVARILHLPPVLLMYLARLANLIATGAVCTLAIWITPALRNVFFLVGLSPVFLSESASCSPDGLTNSVSMLLIAVVLKCAYDAKTRLDRTQIATLAVLSVVLALCKPAYFLLPLLYFIIPATKARTSREYYAAGVAILLLGVVAMSAWAAVAMPTYATPPGLVDLAESRGYAVAHPLEIGLIVARNLGLQWQYYVSSAFGLLGWLDTPMSPAIIVTFVFILLGVAATEYSDAIHFSIKAKTMVLFVAAVTTIIIIASQYLARQVGSSDEIRLAQGRYFLPVIPLFLSLLYGGKVARFTSGAAERLTVEATGILFPILGLWFVIHRYYSL